MAFDAGRIEATGDIDLSPFLIGLRKMTAEGEKFAQRRFTATLDFNTTTASQARLDKMRAQLDRLNAKRVTPTFDPNVAAGITKLKLADEQIKKLDNDSKRSAGRQGGVGLLGLALAGLVPLAGPLGATLAGAAGAGAIGFAGLAVAIKGAVDEAKAGTATGQQYTAVVNSLGISFKQLERTGAGALLASTADAAGQLQSKFPQLNNSVQEFATIGGDAANNALRLILTLLTKANPEVVKFGNFIDGALEKANAWASGTGFDKFLAYVDTEGPVVAKTLGDVASALVHVVGSLSGLGNLYLKGFDTIARFVDHLPPPVIEALAVAYAAWALSVKVLGDAAGPVGSRLEKMGLSVGKVAAGVTAGVVGFDLLSHAGDSLVKTQDKTQAALGSTIRFVTDYKDTLGGLSDVINGDLDGAQAHLRKITDPTGVKADAANIQFAINNLSDTIRGSYTKTLNDAEKAQTRFIDSINYKQGLSGLSSQLGTVTTAMQKQLEVEQSLDGVGQGRAISVQGQTFNQKEYHAALVQTNGDVGKAIGLLQANSIAATGLSSEIERLNRQQGRINDAVGEAQAKYKLTTDQVDTYAAAIGVSGDMLARGIVSSDNFAAAIGRVAAKVAEANTSNAAWIASIDIFNKSGKTQADIGSLIAAAFQAGRGIALDWATANLQAATAAEGVGQVIKDNIKSIGINGTLLGQLVKVGNDWKIQQPQLSAGSLAIAQSLTSQATAAQSMAAQTYQNEFATRGATAAANDALGVYLGYRNELIRQAEQSGLSKVAAHALADQYLAVPKNVQTFIKQIGKKDVAKAISDLTAALNHFSTIVAKATVGIDGASAANAALDGIIAKIGQVNKTSINPKPNTPGGPSIPGLPGSKAGGGLPEGWSTVGEGASNTWELVHKQGSQVDVVPNSKARQLLPGGPGTAMVPGFAGGTLNGIQYKTDLAYHNALVRAQQSSARADAAQRKAERGGEQQLAASAGLTSRILGTSNATSASNIQSLLDRMRIEVTKATQYNVASGALTAAIKRESSALAREVSLRNYTVGKLATANQKLAAVNQNIAQEESTVRGSVLGSFDIGTSGSGYATRILSRLTSSAADAKKFATLLAKAKKMGLNPALVAQLAEEGPATAGKNLEAIVNAGTGYIAQVNEQYHQLGVAADSAGSVAALAKYGAEQARDLAAVKKLQQQQLREQQLIARYQLELSNNFKVLQRDLLVAARKK